MSTHQSVLVVGRLGRDPELKYTNQGTPVCNLSLATDESWTDNQGQRQQATEWHKVVVFGKQAEAAANYLAKGRLALVEGRLRTQKWQDQQGQDRYTTQIRAGRVIFLGGQGQQEQQPQGPPQQAQGYQQQPQQQQQQSNFNPYNDNVSGPPSQKSGPSQDWRYEEAPF